MTTTGKADRINKPSIARSTATMSTATALSRATGFVRTWAMAYALGANTLASSFWVANNIPNMIFELVAGGIISSLFIPTFMELLESEDDNVAWRFASHLFNLAVVVLGVIAVLGTIFARPFVLTQMFRLSPADAQKAIELGVFFFRFFAIQIVFYGGGTIISALLNAQRRYLWPAVGPVFNNVVVIGVFLAFPTLYARSHTLGLVELAVGTTLGVVAMYGVQLPVLLRSGMRYEFGIDLSDPGIRRIAKLALPTLLYVITNLVAVSFRNASAFAVTGKGPAALGYAWMFYQLPYGIFAVALATAVFTELSSTAGKGDMVAFKEHLSRGLRSTGVLMLPMAALLFALAEPLVTLYRVGQFTPGDVPVVAGVLRGWAVALVFFATSMFLLRTFYSLKDTRTPMIVNLVLTPVLQVGLYLLLSTGVGSWHGIGLPGIPLADAVFYAATFATLGLLLRKRIGSFDAAAILSVFARMTVAALAGGAAAWALARYALPPATGFESAALSVAVAGSAGLAVALAFGRALGVREVGDALALLGRLLSRLTRKAA